MFGVRDLQEASPLSDHIVGGCLLSHPSADFQGTCRVRAYQKINNWNMHVEIGVH